MNIGVVGIGVVGSAVKYGFEKLGHKVFTHDTRHYTSIEDVMDTDVVFICVPTPSLKNGKCNVHIVKDVVFELNKIDYKGIIAIKSTVEPGTTQKLQEKYPDRKICYVPEFLRERCAITDFCENHDLCIIGTDKSSVFNLIKKAHGRYPRNIIQLSVTEAELVKYFNNVYAATLITFANSFYEICEGLGVNYTNVKNAVVNRKHITDKYLDCNENFRGFGGVCLPKDTKALNRLAKELKVGGKLFKTILDDNERYETTVFKGMRKSSSNE
tara:strand:- start:32848 stop:33657 length:810 start_codon:yes stop_codon:yes gene_type:complete